MCNTTAFDSGRAVVAWQGIQGLNLYCRSQSAVCYHYTNSLYVACLSKLPFRTGAQVIPPHGALRAILADFEALLSHQALFLCGARCLLHIRKLETHAGTDIRESNPTHRVLETPSPPWNICPHICPADIPVGAERSPSCYLRAAAYVIKEKGCLSITRTQFDYMLSAPKSQ